MTRTLPSRLSELLQASDPGAREKAWEAFLAEFSPIILRAARNGSTSRDETMDRYAFSLEKLKRDEFGRLRSFKVDGRGEFTTWLFLVTRRLAVDHHRTKYGRSAQDTNSDGPTEGTSPEQLARRRLTDLLAEEVDPGRIPDPCTQSPEAHAWLQERRRILESALARLPVRDQLLVTLRFVDGVSVRQIARALRFRSPFQAYRRLNKVLTQLRRDLESRGITGPEG
ncbi:MAG: sigma-70 family RNA polymerase sigma factor [Gemmatimonadota bacterium]|jgi:RNA polymerase sigma factor (sigma-70 family)